MTEGNIFGTVKKIVIIVFIARICYKITKEQLSSLNSHEIRIGKSWRWEKPMSLCNGYVTLTSLYWLRCKVFDVMVFASPFCLCLQSYHLSWQRAIAENIDHHQGLLRKWKCGISYQKPVHNGHRAIIINLNNFFFT